MGRRMRHGGWWESGHGRQVSGGRWPDGASPPPDRRGVGAGRIGRRRGSYQGAWRGRVRGWWRPCSMVASRAGANAATIVVAAAKLGGLPKPVFSPCPRVGPWTQGSPPTTGSITSRPRSPGAARSSQRERLVRPIGPGRRSPVQPDTFSVCYRNPAGPAFAGPASYSRFQKGAVSTPLHHFHCHQPAACSSRPSRDAGVYILFIWVG